ncbi:MAG: VanW family protein, partial [Bacteroidota bacterium]
MLGENTIEKPKVRSSFRRKLGRHFFIWKRKFKWWFGKERYAVPTEISFQKSYGKRTHRKVRNINNPVSVIHHKSVLLRPLKDVDMYLQHNKVINLQIACAAMHGTIIYPGQTFSLWRLVGKPSKSKGYLEGLALH